MSFCDKELPRHAIFSMAYNFSYTTCNSVFIPPIVICKLLSIHVKISPCVAKETLLNWKYVGQMHFTIFLCYMDLIKTSKYQYWDNLFGRPAKDALTQSWLFWWWVVACLYDTRVRYGSDGCCMFVRVRYGSEMQSWSRFHLVLLVAWIYDTSFLVFEMDAVFCIWLISKSIY